MSKKSSTKIAVDPDDVYETPIRQSDITSGKLILRQRDQNGAVIMGKVRVNMYLDSAVVSHFKEKAGDRGYQTLINEALKSSIQTEGLEATVRHVVRQELKAYKVS